MDRPGIEWNVIKTARFKENYVKAQLSAIMDADVFLPMLKIPKQCLRIGQAQVEPLFPGYLFARLNLPEQMLALRRVQAFHSLVCFDGRPASVEAEVIDDLRRREKGRGYIDLHFPKQRFPLHGAVRVVAGPFNGQTGLLLRYVDSTQRVSILLDLLRTGVRLEVPAEAVAVVPPVRIPPRRQRADWGTELAAR